MQIISNGLSSNCRLLNLSREWKRLIAPTAVQAANNDEALPGVLRNRGIRLFISGEQGNKCLKLKGTGNKGSSREQETENQDFDFGEQGKMPIFFQGNKGTGTPPGRASMMVQSDIVITETYQKLVQFSVRTGPQNAHRTAGAFDTGD